MRLRNIKNADEILANSKYYIKNPSDLKGKYKTLFGNDKPIMLEIGMGKADFIIGMATLHPEYNFIGVEKYESVLAKGVEKLNKIELDNVRVMSIDAIKLGDVFDHEIDTIYLNFSDPWPKKRHYKRRLTYRDFLSVYDKLFVGDAKIKMKTDNDGLFASSLIELNNYGYKFENIYLDLHTVDIENVKTEYEIKFSSKGFKIKYVSATKSICKD